MAVDEDAGLDPSRAVPHDHVRAGRDDQRARVQRVRGDERQRDRFEPHISTGPPFERLYAVEPDGVEQMIPSHGWRPSSSPATASSSSIMRPSDALETTTSFTATVRPSG